MSVLSIIAPLVPLLAILALERIFLIPRIRMTYYNSGDEKYFMQRYQHLLREINHAKTLGKSSVSIRLLTNTDLISHMQSIGYQTRGYYTVEGSYCEISWNQGCQKSQASRENTTNYQSNYQ